MPRTHIKLETGEPIPVADLIETLRRESRTYIIQGQTIGQFRDHPKPKSLDYWLRTRSRYPNTKLADNNVLEQLVATGLFELQGALMCPDSGRKCKGLTLLHRGPSGNRVAQRGRSSGTNQSVRVSRAKSVEANGSKGGSGSNGTGVPRAGKPHSRRSDSATMSSKSDVVTLGDAITKLAKEHVSERNDWYRWRTINEGSLPAGITLPNGNQYEKNLALKKQLNREIQCTTAGKTREDLVKYYVSTWGGIHSNSEETLEFYASASADALIARGRKGIASWSKVLCILEPDEFAIFDARVSASLNSLQMIHNVADKQRFPLLSSQNKVIKRGNQLLKAKNWTSVPNQAFYRMYLGYLKNTVSSLDGKLGASVATIEMLLFAKAEDLLREAFPGQRF